MRGAWGKCVNCYMFLLQKYNYVQWSLVHMGGGGGGGEGGWTGRGLEDLLCGGSLSTLSDYISICRV